MAKVLAGEIDKKTNGHFLLQLCHDSVFLPVIANVQQPEMIAKVCNPTVNLMVVAYTRNQLIVTIEELDVN